MLLSCGSMRENGFVIDTVHDMLYVPVDFQAAKNYKVTEWTEVPLHWTGAHYLLPIDVEDNTVYNTVNVATPFGKGEDPVVIPYPYSKVMTSKDWNLLAMTISKQVGTTVSLIVLLTTRPLGVE